MGFLSLEHHKYAKYKSNFWKYGPEYNYLEAYEWMEWSLWRLLDAENI